MSEIILLSLGEVKKQYAALPKERKIATLSPEYIVADAARNQELEPVFIGYKEGNFIWWHGAHKAKVLDTDYWDLQSPYGYGGPMTNSYDYKFIDRAWSSYSQWCYENGILLEFVRLHPLMDYKFLYKGNIRNNRDVVIVPLLEQDIRLKYQVRCRTAVRKAKKKGLYVEERPLGEIITHFKDFYYQGMKLIGADKFFFFHEEYFESIINIPGIILLVCMLDGEWLSAGIFFNGDVVLEYHLSASTQKGRKLSATNLLIDAAIFYAKGKGKEVLYLGGGSDCMENNPLLFFKSGFSSDRLKFSIGYSIHNDREYQLLKNMYIKSSSNNNILFYR